MNEEGFEEWDADFLDQLIQVEELALTSSTVNPNPNPNPSSHQPNQLPQQEPLRSVAVPHFSYSPPRELSQRTHTHTHTNIDSSKCASLSTSPPSLRRSSESENHKDLQVESLKRELGRVSQQLTDLEQECLELRKKRDKKEDRHQYAFSRNELKEVDVYSSKSTKSEYGVLSLDHHGVPRKIQNAISSHDQASSRIDTAMPIHKAIGVQTDEAGDPALGSLNDDLPACHALSEKLVTIWGSPSDQKLGRNLISKLLVASQTDFHVLFRCVSMNVSKMTMDCLADGSSSDVALKFHTLEAAKVSRLYSVLTKISNGMVQLEALFEPLLDLCSLEKNVVIVHRSLSILHVFLKHLLSLERKSKRRDNITVEGLLSGNNIVDSHGFEGAKYRGECCVSRNETSYACDTPFGIRIPDAEIPCKGGPWNRDIEISVSRVDWVSLIEVMCQIVMRSTEECVRLEAVSVINVVLMRSNTYVEREKFGQTMVFESLSELLRKESGFRVQKHAVHLLYLLLNCPTLLVMFCCGCNEGEGPAVVDDNARPASTFQKFSNVLQGLADCVACCGNSIQELTLRRNAIIVLAFLASSGKPGFEIVVSHKVYREANFLMLILQVLKSEMDREAAVCAEPPEIFQERTLLMREALILLNRLVSNPAYSVTVLRVLTNSRDMASLTIDVANRLSRKDRIHEQSDSMTRQMRESEIVNLARVFQKRVFTYLGENIS